ncbi:MAG: bacillithiol biosynthesis deacetylase BshB1 [Candidatus Electryonea clarkiae]|nr:bacillithiol biosynthesis deacetylase BshB1 [Candidatus Electryonea clarkiae]MDP8285497.1 bacillithiol biosynthesis deacetylase BshB1 [Candidatus Electryonea clarkiae]
MSLDVLAFGPHPDDVEIHCGGTISKLVRLGYSVGIIDMTAGELGTRGSEEERAEEAANAGKILGINFRENLHLPDGGLNSRDYIQRDTVVECIRKHKPDMLIGPVAKDRHPDHRQGMYLVEEGCFLANVGKWSPSGSDKPSDLPRHKVKALLRYPIWWHPQADLIVDVSDDWETRMKAVRAYRTQFYTEGVEGPKTFLSTPQFVEWVEGRGSQFGAQIGVNKGEPFLLRNPVPVDDPIELLVNGAGMANP